MKAKQKLDAPEIEVGVPIFPDCGCHYTIDDNGITFCSMHAAAPDMLDALKLAEEIVRTARQYFPKSIKNKDTFMLNNYGVAINKAIAKAEVE